VTLHFITPGRPMENGYIESFHGKFREECLNEHWFLTLDDARETIEVWRLDYNRVRPHSSLGYLTPQEFRMGYANVESKTGFPLLEWSAACSVGRLFWLAGGFPWIFRRLAST
jgi:putative transposase